MTVWDRPPNSASTSSIQRLRASVAKMNADQAAVIRRQLARADALAATDRAAAENIWRGVITLYSGKAWATELVDEARSKLDK